MNTSSKNQVCQCGILQPRALMSGVRAIRDCWSVWAVSKQADEGDERHDDLVLAAIARLLAEGKRVSTSFKHELFSFKPKKQRGSTATWELGDMTRAEARAAVQRLIDAGIVLRDASGALHLPQSFASW